MTFHVALSLTEACGPWAFALSHKDHWAKDKWKPLASQSPWSTAYRSCIIWGGKDPLCLVRKQSSLGEGMTLPPWLMQSIGILQPGFPACVGAL